MKAIWEHPVTGSKFHVDILDFINDGYAVIRQPNGWLDITLVTNLRVLEGDLDDRQS